MQDAVSQSWTHVPISNVEDLSDAVLGAGLNAVQMSRVPVRGSLAFATCDGILYGTGFVGAQVALTGALSESMVTLGLGLELPPGSRQWLNEVTTGEFGVFRQGDFHDALYMPGSLYATATLSAERLEEFAAQNELVLDAKTLGATGIANQRIPDSQLSVLQAYFRNIHARNQRFVPGSVGRSLLGALVWQLGRIPHPYVGRANPNGLARAVDRARAFIYENLDRPLSIVDIARAASTSERTLHRAFVSIFNESPYSYVQKLRLHRIRYELISENEKNCTITMVATRWGVHELGRLSGRYRDLCGELPSETIARSHENPDDK